MTKKRILVIEDERELARLVELHLRDAGFEVALAHDGRRGLELATSGDFDCLVLDLMLPGLDGLDLCQQLRRRSVYTPILMLTARSSEGDRVLGLEVGADDYLTNLTKPFSVRELVARVRAIFRRIEVMAHREEAITVGDLHIDPQKRRASRGSRRLALTAKEFDLLAHFARHPGRVYSRAELLDQVWGYGYGGYEHTVNSHINRLRAKLEDDPAQPRYVLTAGRPGVAGADPGVPRPAPFPRPRPADGARRRPQGAGPAQGLLRRADLCPAAGRPARAGAGRRLPLHRPRQPPGRVRRRAPARQLHPAAVDPQRARLSGGGAGRGAVHRPPHGLAAAPAGGADAGFPAAGRGRRPGAARGRRGAAPRARVRRNGAADRAPDGGHRAHGAGSPGADRQRFPRPADPDRLAARLPRDPGAQERLAAEGGERRIPADRPLWPPAPAPSTPRSPDRPVRSRPARSPP